jgi:hypothetical protein
MGLGEPSPLIVDDVAPAMLPACPLPGRAREHRPLFVLQTTVWLRTIHGWLRIPRGYVTDFGSIPALATALTLTDLQPIGAHAWAALGHDWRYAIGQVGLRPIADEIFRERMRVDGVPAYRREVMYRAVRLGGAGGYAEAPSWWATENFADPVTGLPIAPPFQREEAFDGARYGLRPAPYWPN